MIIAGDIASPNAELSKNLKEVFEEHSNIFAGKNFLFNLEGAISNEDLTQSPTPVLYNHSSIFDSFGSFNKVVACLSNNHLLDLPANFDNTISQLQKNNIAYTGAGKSFEEAYQPAIIEENGKPVFIFNECWEFLLYHQQNPSDGIYLAELKFKQLIELVKECRNKNTGSIIFVYVHWGLDLEVLPFPMYRKFAKKLIDAGANSVLGCHSHCVQGGEKYKDGYIIYSLGNYFLPNHIFANGKLFFPPFAAIELVLEYNANTGKALCHWFEYKETNGAHKIVLIESASFESSNMMKTYSLSYEMEDQKYDSYFKKRRRKHFMIPIFKEYENDFMLALSTGFLKKRARIARMMAKFNLIKWGS